MSDSTTLPCIEIGFIVLNGFKTSIRSTSLRLVTSVCKVVIVHSLISFRMAQRSLLSKLLLGHSSKASMIIKTCPGPLVKDFIADKRRS